MGRVLVRVGDEQAELGRVKIHIWRIYITLTETEYIANIVMTYTRRYVQQGRLVLVVLLKGGYGHHIRRVCACCSYAVTLQRYETPVILIQIYSKQFSRLVPRNRVVNSTFSMEPGPWHLRGVRKDMLGSEWLIG